jgi:hypothetical protein
MSDNPRLVNLRIGKRTYPVRTTLEESQVRKLETLLGALAFEEGPGTSQEESLVLMVLKLVHALEKARIGLERLSGREGES